MHHRPLTCFILVLGLALMAMAYTGGWIRTAHAAFTSKAHAGQERIDRLFKAMGIIKLAGIAPPVEIELEDLNGKTVRIADFKGKIVLLNFWTTWCPECRAEMPSMEKLFHRFKDREFAMVAVSLREPARQVEAFFKKYKLSFTALLDTEGEIGIRFGIRSIPTTFILNQKGGLIGKALGSRKWDSEEAAALFEHLISNKTSLL